MSEKNNSLSVCWGDCTWATLPYAIPTPTAQKRECRIYSGWGQNDAQVVLESLVRTIKRKVEIAARHSFESVDEVWLLVCGGIPEQGAAISTFVMTPCLSAAEMGQATYRLLQGSKYDCCFFLPILGVEQAFYGWERNRGWKKSVKLNDLREAPRAVYVNNLHRAVAAGDWQEVERLCDEECKIAVSENWEP